MTTRQRRTSWLTGLLAVLYYEFLWNLRKKKTIGLFILIFAIATLQLALPPILAYYQGRTLANNPNVVINFPMLLSGIFMFLIAVATTMNTISGEFETGTITPLLTKPVSRNLVFIAKVTAAFLTLLAVYAFLTIYVMIGAIIIDGPQDYLPLVPLGLVGLTIATMVWASIVLFLGTISKSSLVAALGSFGVWIGVSIAGVVIASFLGQTSVLFYAPGSGATASTGDCGPETFTGTGTAVFATGTDNLGYLLMRLVAFPNEMLNFCGIRFRGNTTEPFLASSDTITGVAFRALGVSLAYLAVFLALSWYAFRRAQITESS